MIILKTFFNHLPEALREIFYLLRETVIRFNTILSINDPMPIKARLLTGNMFIKGSDTLVNSST